MKPWRIVRINTQSGEAMVKHENGQSFQLTVPEPRRGQPHLIHAYIQNACDEFKLTPKSQPSAPVPTYRHYIDLAVYTLLVLGIVYLMVRFK